MWICACNDAFMKQGYCINLSDGGKIKKFFLKTIDKSFSMCYNNYAKLI